MGLEAVVKYIASPLTKTLKSFIRNWEKKVVEVVISMGDVSILDDLDMIGK